MQFFSLAFLGPAALLLIQYAVLAGLHGIARPAAYIVMVAAPLLAAAAVAWRGRADTSAARAGWYALGVSLVIWALGAFGNLWQEWILGRTNEMYRAAMLAFNLAAVPIAVILAGEWGARNRPLARAVDAVMASALGYAFFLLIWAVLTARGAPDEAGVNTLVWLLDAQNLLLTTGAFVRWYAAAEASQQRLFRAISIYQFAYLVLIFYNNHFVAGDPNFGPEQSAIITIAFALLAAVSLARPRPVAGPVRRPRPGLARAIRSTSPILLAGVLLIVSLFLIRWNYAVGSAGILIAMVGYGVRTTSLQMRHMERGDTLQRERSELQAIAWTDALTGVANRHFLDQALVQAARRQQPVVRPLSVLMIDIDHFKLLNDRYGHPAGDACLRSVAGALQRTLVRPGDLLARYGGEEFIALLHDADTAGALVVAERLRAAVELLGIEHLDSPFGVVTVSVGVATALREGSAAAVGLVQAADSALYEAKRGGRNQIRSLVLAVA